MLIINELHKKLGIKTDEVSRNGVFSLEETACMGACGFGPVMAVNDKYYTKMNIEKLIEVIDYYKNMEE